ncbi:TLP18.3, Psb32 and MOLO-1 founding protein of phosphatase [Verrucomicrobium sp. GAS474]|uniref:TPM domain-containing protein n=1 Tax=Verrucomicrobium sp. GAS474 TaxID=1882831 RepID=UPI00087BD332|nr:TPM domain-containing protein [Verrucomicrobium sp. GAS474]SDT87171.1 TLP18.3, Psb32 and MOLO-1 founding protein of phosphatase [Verrucomicrobium sp. GAS474]
MNFSWLFPFRHRKFLSALDHDALVHAIAGAEARTSGEIRLFVTRHRVGDPVAAAQAQFLRLGMEKTALRNGVLLLVAPASRNFALVGDTGIHAKIGTAAWEEITAQIAACFREGDFHAGLVSAVARIGDHLAAHFPRGEADRNELSDAVTED